jgi:diguanylate cyclase (GGDEF)-like protein
MIPVDDKRMTPGVDGESNQRAATSLAASDLVFGDIDSLFRAVRERIALTTSDAFAAQCVTNGDDPAVQIRATVLECVGELDQLHATMTYEVGRRRLLERTVDDLQNALATVQADLTGTRAAEREANHRALHDSLTLLPNAELFRSKVDNALAQARERQLPLALVFLDLDGFKAINDSHGHATGDAVLRIVSVRLAGGIRGEDLVSRIAGDEFACLLAGVSNREHLSRLVCKIFDTVASPLQIGQLNLSVRPSIGVAMWPADGTTSDALMRNADAAMYRAKRQKCGYVFYDQPGDENDDERDGSRMSSIFDRMALTEGADDRRT